MRNATCSILGCNRPHKARGWCGTHYARWKCHGDPLKGARKVAGRPCSVGGCDSPVQARDLCSAHFQRVVRRGRLHRINFHAIDVNGERLCEFCWTWKVRDSFSGGVGRRCLDCHAWRIFWKKRMADGEPVGRAQNHQRLLVTPTVVYRHWAADGSLLYVGISAQDSYRRRQVAHKNNSHWWPDVHEITTVLYDNRKDAQLAEALAVANENPAWNVAQPMPYAV